MSNEELAARVEALDGPDREVDRHLARVVGWHPAGVDDRLLKGDAAWLYENSCPAYTASLDAAMTLKPQGWRLVGLSEHLAPLPHCKARLQFWYDESHGQAATPALALCAAALRAREPSNG